MAQQTGVDYLTFVNQYLNKCVESQYQFLVGKVFIDPSDKKLYVVQSVLLDPLFNCPVVIRRPTSAMEPATESYSRLPVDYVWQCVQAFGNKTITQTSDAHSQYIDLLKDVGNVKATKPSLHPNENCVDTTEPEMYQRLFTSLKEIFAVCSDNASRDRLIETCNTIDRVLTVPDPKHFLDTAVLPQNSISWKQTFVRTQNLIKFRLHTTMPENALKIFASFSANPRSIASSLGNWLDVHPEQVSKSKYLGAMPTESSGNGSQLPSAVSDHHLAKNFTTIEKGDSFSECHLRVDSNVIVGRSIWYRDAMSITWTKAFVRGYSVEKKLYDLGHEYNSLVGYDVWVVLHDGNKKQVQFMNTVLPGDPSGALQSQSQIPPNTSSVYGPRKRKLNGVEVDSQFFQISTTPFAEDKFVRKINYQMSRRANQIVDLNMPSAPPSAKQALPLINFLDLVIPNVVDSVESTSSVPSSQGASSASNNNVINAKSASG